METPNSEVPCKDTTKKRDDLDEGDEKDLKQKSSARNYFISIIYDSIFLAKVISYFHENDSEHDFQAPERWPVVSNERCGSWYAFNHATSPSTHFKSTDGHINIWNFSLKRLNLQFLYTAVSSSKRISGKCGGVLLVDASRAKSIPDSFSKTVPIWCCLLNRVASYYRQEHDSLFPPNEFWDDKLYVPEIISEEEREGIETILPDRLKSVIDSGVILDPLKFITLMQKPLRCFWITNHYNSQHNKLHIDRDFQDDMERVFSSIMEAQDNYTCIICVSCSNVNKNSSASLYINDDIAESSDDKFNDETFIYTSGAADDHEAWSMGLTPTLFWEHRAEILGTSEDDIGSRIKDIVLRAKEYDEEWYKDGQLAFQTNIQIQNKSQIQGYERMVGLQQHEQPSSLFDYLGPSQLLAIGSRRAGRPPECWDHFDCIVNVTTMEYETLAPGNNDIPNEKYYLQLPIKEGKRDKTELEKWLALAIAFIAINVGSNRRVLIHCAQGKDRSVAVAMAVLCILCSSESLSSNNINEEGAQINDPDRGLILHSWYSNMSLESLSEFVYRYRSESKTDEIESLQLMYLNSGIPMPIVNALRSEGGRDLLFQWVRGMSTRTHSNHNSTSLWLEKSAPQIFGTKDSLRLVLMLIQRYRSIAEPTRKTLQKLNRFFMSGL